MNRILPILIALLIAATSCAQIVESSPELPSAASQNITITYHADKGTAGLQNYSGDVYMHTGVVMKGSSSWEKVKAGWTDNLPECKMRRASANTYTITMTSIKDFYGLSEQEAANVDKLAMVFRSADGSREGKDTGGKDIFLQVYDASQISISIKKPAQGTIFVDPGQQIDVEIATSQPCEVKCGGSTVEGGRISITAESSGVHALQFVAADGKASATLTYIVRQPAQSQEMPKGLRRGASIGPGGQAYFVLYAPGKKSAYITGDFTGWQITQQSAMKKDGDYFWAEFPGLASGQEYAYQYIVDEYIRIADPYAEKILDPDNDKYIPESVYPSLTYPHGKASGIAAVFSPGKNKYQFQSKITPPKPEDLAIYELLIRDFTQEGTIQAAAQRLDYLQALGINAIELMPFSEFEGNDSWGYNPSFYFAPDKAYGTPKQYKAFIDECHKRGIAVIQDIVLNHSFGQCPLVQLYMNGSNASSDSPWYNTSSPNTAYSWGYDFNHESPETQRLVDSIMAYWISEYNIDGYRLDFTKGFTNTKGDGWAYDASRIRILKRIYDRISAIKPGAYMICEHLTDSKEEKELSDYGIMLWKNLNNAFCQSAMGWEEGSSTDGIFSPKSGYPKNNVVAYAESHDEERMAYKCLAYGNANPRHNVKDKETYLSRLKGAAIILLAAPGPKMIWQFGEIGYDYSINYNPATGRSDSGDGRTARKPIIPGAMEDPARMELLNTYATMLSLRAQSPAMKSESARVETSGLFKVVYRDAGKHSLIFAANFGMEPTTQSIDFAQTGTWYNVITGEQINVSAKQTAMKFLAGQSAIFSNSPDDIRTPASDIAKPKAAKVEIFPNPAESMCRISGSRLSEVRLFGPAGQLLRIVSNIKDEACDLDISSLNPGMYLISAKLGKTTAFERIIKN